MFETGDRCTKRLWPGHRLFGRPCRRWKSPSSNDHTFSNLTFEAIPVKAQMKAGLVGCRTLILISAGLAGSLFADHSDAREKPMIYRVTRVEQTVDFDTRWDGDFWREVQALELQNYMGKKPEHFPRVQAKLAYDERAVCVIFLVDDRFVRAVARTHQDAVCRDSCVEFFFTPGEEVGQGYFNLEMNCGGTMLFHYQRAAGQDNVQISGEELAQIDVSHSLPKIIDPEIADETQWTVAYRLPVEVFSKYATSRFRQPAPGVIWRANLYKCADDTSHPHWLTWSHVEFERPDFHRPQTFGTLVFE